jgi:hypothetical protein
MFQIINDIPVEILGDVHLGRKFRNGVPLHRRGEREEAVWAGLEASLEASPSDGLHVQMGDLFDKMVVPYSVVMRAASLYRQAARCNEACTFVVLRGNHDASRDTSQWSALDVFKALVRDQKNILVVDEEPAYLWEMGFYPWCAFKTAAEMAADTPKDIVAAFGHWDVKSFGGSDDNLLPIEQLAEVEHIFTGHDHKPRVEMVPVSDGRRLTKFRQVTVVGSMQPYAHGEDADDSPDPMYVTYDLDQLPDPPALVNKCVRVRLKPGQELPDIDCLQLTPQRIDAEGRVVDTEVEFAAFDMARLMTETFTEANLPAGVISALTERFSQLRELSDA